MDGWWALQFLGDDDLEWGIDEARLTPTSVPDNSYNCFGWAVDQGRRFWDHSGLPGTYWPADAPRAETIDAYTAAFATEGWVPCDDGALEIGFEKVVLYATNYGTRPWHASRQLPDGAWTTKFGTALDASHPDVATLVSRDHGRPVRYFRRPR